MSTDHPSTRDLGMAVSDNFERAFGTLAANSARGASRQFGSVTAVSVGVPTPVFNRVFVFEPPSPKELTAAITWMTQRGDPFWVTAEASLADKVATATGGFDLEVSENTQPGMAFTPLRGIDPGESVVDIEPATDSDALDDWSSIGEDVFDFSSETTRLLTPPSVLTDNKIRLFVGRIDDTPAACGLLVRTDDVAGVYTIGVKEMFRRRGFGEAMTREVLGTGRELGCRIGVLQSSEMGVPLYERMGFETVVEYRHCQLDA
jgi:GNAT superfamily N-acetyltransferase